MTKIRIGTRKSRLALAQTELFAKELSTRADVCVEIVLIVTRGDVTLDKPLASFGGKGVFVSEFESALQKGEIDAAIHSAKDLPLDLADGMEVSCVLKRGDCRDVLVTRKGIAVDRSSVFTVGTGSLRREMFIKKLYPNVTVKGIRGNVDTRLKKMLGGEYDGLILAAAGLERLELLQSDEYTATPFECSTFLPSPCQGIITAECRAGDELSEVFSAVNDEDTFHSFQTERCITKLLSVGCGTPLGVYSKVNGNEITITASMDGVNFYTQSGSVCDRFKLAERLAKML